jgi:hypothetical protein
MDIKEDKTKVKLNKQQIPPCIKLKLVKLQKKGWEITEQSERYITLRRNKRFNSFALIFLILFFNIFGLVGYLLYYNIKPTFDNKVVRSDKGTLFI